jgi:hypothetical protein
MINFRDYQLTELYMLGLKVVLFQINSIFAFHQNKKNYATYNRPFHQLCNY